MPAQGPDEYVSRVAEQLTLEFGKIMPRAAIEDVVREARRDLDGQVIPGALDEMLHRLAHYRLTQLSPA